MPEAVSETTISDMSDESDSHMENVVNPSDDDEPAGNNSGWADAMSKILRSGPPKKRRKKTTGILSRGLTDDEALKRKLRNEQQPEGFQVVPRADSEEKSPTTKQEPKTVPEIKTPRQLYREMLERKQKKRDWDQIGRVKPDVTDRERERKLSRIATRGVVQLFNAVRQRQQTLETKLNEAGGSERKREKLLKEMDKGTFLDVLKSGTKNTTGSKKDNTNKKSSTKPAWNVLREDFMLGAKLKDWDKELEEEREVEEQELE